MSDTNLKSEHLWTILEATEEYDGAPVGEERMCPTWVAKAILEDVKTLLAANEALKARAQGEWVQCDIETKSNLISRAQFRGITEQGFGLFRREQKEQADDTRTHSRGN